MSGLPWLNRNLKPPFGAVEIDSTHKLARGLGALWLLNEGGGGPIDLVNQQRSTLNGAVSWTRGPSGLSLNYPAGAGDYVTLGATPALTASAPAGTFAVIFEPRTSAESGYKALLQTRTGGQFIWLGFAGGVAGNPLTYSWEGIEFDSNTGLTYVAGHRYIGLASMTATGTEMRLAEFGGTTLTYTDAQAHTAKDLSTGWELGRDSGAAGREFDGVIYYAAIWRRALTSAELSDVIADPYFFLRPKVRLADVVFTPTTATGAAAGMPLDRYFRNLRVA